MSRLRKAVFIVVYYLEKNKPNYLILERKLHWKGWEFPKGGINFLEFKKHAVKRELFEETGSKPIKIKNHYFKGKYNYKEELKDRKGISGQTFLLFSVQVKKQKVKLDKKEHKSYLWLDFNKTLKKLTHKNQRQCLRIVNNWLKHDKP